MFESCCKDEVLVTDWNCNRLAQGDESRFSDKTKKKNVLVMITMMIFVVKTAMVGFWLWTVWWYRLRLKCDGTHSETRFRLSAKRTSTFKYLGASVQSTTGSRSVCISGSNAGYTMFRGSVKSTGYPLHSPVSPSFPLPCVTVCHHISTGLYCTWVTTFKMEAVFFCVMSVRSYHN